MSLRQPMYVVDGYIVCWVQQWFNKSLGKEKLVDPVHIYNL